MIKCICIDDNGRPSKIPANKWLVEGMEYHIVYATYVLPQRKIAVQLREINLDDSCAPYEYFLAERFSFNDEQLIELINLIRDCIHADDSVKKLIKQDERTANTV
jgi:nuclear transport factor 2 (NTF2) superfamily protein